jgi:hypothetical protein
MRTVKVTAVMILLGFTLNSCTSTGSGSAVITKIASREEANSILENYDLTSPFVDAALLAQQLMLNQYVDSNQFKVIAVYDYNSATNTLSTSSPTLYSRSRQKVQITPHDANGLPTASVINLKKTDILEYAQDDGESEYNYYDSVYINVTSFPYDSVFSGKVINLPLSCTGSIRRTYHSSYSISQTDFAADMSGSASMTNWREGFAVIGGKVKAGVIYFNGTNYLNEPVDDLDMNVNVRFKLVVTPRAASNFLIDVAYYLDFGGYGYTLNSNTFTWTPYELDF